MNGKKIGMHLEKMAETRMEYFIIMSIHTYFVVNVCYLPDPLIGLFGFPHFVSFVGIAFPTPVIISTFPAKYCKALVGYCAKY